VEPLKYWCFSIRDKQHAKENWIRIISLRASTTQRLLTSSHVCSHPTSKFKIEEKKKEQKSANLVKKCKEKNVKKWFGQLEKNISHQEITSTVV